MKSLVIAFFAALSVVLSLGLLSAACATTTYPTTVAQIADEGTRVVQTAHQISLTAQSLEATVPQILSTDKAAAIVAGAYQIETDGQKLATLLAAYSQAKGTVQAPMTAASIQLVIADMDSALATINRAIPPGTVNSITSLAANILSLMGQIKAGLLLAGA